MIAGMHPAWLMFALAAGGVLVQTGINLGVVKRVEDMTTDHEKRIQALERFRAVSDALSGHDGGGA